MSDDEDHDDLRRLLGRLDPVPDRVAMEPPTSESARARLEYVMNIDTAPGATDRRQRRWWATLGVAAAAAAVVVGITVFGGDSNPDPDPESAAPPLVLDLGAGDSMASCLAPSADVMRSMSPAFAGTVTGIDGETVTLDVDTWYAGGEDAQTVELEAPAGLEALLGSIDFLEGERYFITAAEGTVNYCGFSGPLSDPGLAALVEEAFGS